MTLYQIWFRTKLKSIFNNSESWIKINPELINPGENIVTVG